MIDPTICKFVFVDVISDEIAIYRERNLPIYYKGREKRKKIGRARLYLKYSITSGYHYLALS